MLISSPLPARPMVHMFITISIINTSLVRFFLLASRRLDGSTHARNEHCRRTHSERQTLQIKRHLVTTVAADSHWRTHCIGMTHCIARAHKSHFPTTFAEPYLFAAAECVVLNFRFDFCWPRVLTEESKQAWKLLVRLLIIRLQTDKNWGTEAKATR